jgi:hypothetical protein
MLDLGMNGGAYYIMQKTTLSKLIYTIGQKLIYTFDFLNDRSLLIELTDIIMEKNLSEPMVTLKLGDTPQQVLGEDVDIIDQDSGDFQDDRTSLLFAELEDYTEIYGEMDDF